MGVEMTRIMLAAAGLMLLLLSGSAFGDSHTDWVPTVSNPEIEYRTQVYDNAEACYLEFRDNDQGNGPTTFDAEIQYKTKERETRGEEEIVKIDRENVVTTPTHTGNARISNCYGVLMIRLSVVQRQ
jgi:hypothetical protein